MNLIVLFIATSICCFDVAIVYEIGNPPIFEGNDNWYWHHIPEMCGIFCIGWIGRIYSFDVVTTLILYLDVVTLATIYTYRRGRKYYSSDGRLFIMPMTLESQFLLTALIAAPFLIGWLV